MKSRSDKVRKLIMTCLKFIDILCSNFPHVSSIQDGNQIGIWDLSDQAREAYVAKQSSFVDLGVVKIALKAMATHPANVEGNLADEVRLTLDFWFDWLFLKLCFSKGCGDLD